MDFKKKLREEQNKSREVIAAYLGISLRTYSRIETNERVPDILEIGCIAEYLKVDPIDLQYNEPKMVFEKLESEKLRI